MFKSNEQKAQFNVDWWIYGLLIAKMPLKFYEVPTIEGLANVASNFIDNGMIGGIPKPDWDSVIAAYKGSDEIAKVVGNQNRKNAHALVLDSNGMVIWKCSEGFASRVSWS